MRLSQSCRRSDCGIYVFGFLPGYAENTGSNEAENVVYYLQLNEVKVADKRPADHKSVWR